ncbi:hypothetical protein KZP23_15060 [Echinicola marina]|uniref:hypothetical protein n=1 Tax=Echinicola marina TaxID=2859768 RepID=UPI001CF67B8D|nr:hypothetical protein [Echinicola marina]UCS92034.1 hypothetical protein KZP23_15060 [Echinicola marina]
MKYYILLIFGLFLMMSCESELFAFDQQETFYEGSLVHEDNARMLPDVKPDYNNDDMQDFIRPIIEEFNVDLVLQGHAYARGGCFMMGQ